MTLHPYRGNASAPTSPAFEVALSIADQFYCSGYDFFMMYIGGGQPYEPSHGQT